MYCIDSKGEGGKGRKEVGVGGGGMKWGGEEGEKGSRGNEE